MNTKADRTEVFQALRKARIHTTYWAKIILRAEARGKFTADNIDKSGEWTTCACGRADHSIDVDVYGRDSWGSMPGCPKDLILRQAGKNFFEAVYAHDFMDAALYLIAIEQRARQIHSGAQLRTPE